MEAHKLKVAQDSLQKVHEYRFSGNNGRAFAHFLLFLELLPAERRRHEQYFSDIAIEWCTELELKRQYENVCKCYSQAINYFPKNVEILNSFGSFLLRCNAPLESKVYLNAAHRIDGENLLVLSNLNSANLQLVERWHFRMLNDVRRNSMYNEAIQKSIDGRYNKVLDIGSGSGFLSVCASKNRNTSRVIAIEQSEALSTVTEEVFNRNYVKNAMIFNGNSTDINGIIECSNVLITEIFDSALFGEHCLETLIHAHENLLEKDFRVIPGSAKIYIAGIESIDLAKKHKVISNHEYFSDFCIVESKNEPYDAEQVSKYDHKLLTEAVEMLNIDFSNLEQLKSLYNDPKYIPDIELKIVEAGTLHAFVIWFTLELSDGIFITTNPYSDNCDCWEQAIIFLDHFQPKCKGEMLAISASCAQNKLQITYTNEENSSCDCYQVQKNVVNFLNDSKLIQTLNDASRSIPKAEASLHVLDLYPFPIIGLNLIAQSNATVVTITENADLLRKICDLNGIDFGRFKMISESDLVLSKEYDVIAFDPISNNGTICESFFANYQKYSNALKDDGIFVPNALNLKFALVESDYLVNCNDVSDVNVLGFKIAEYMNKFKASELWIMQIGNFPHKKLTAICDEYKVQFDDAFFSRECRVESVNGRVDGILYWFDIHYTGKVSMDTYKSNYYNKVVSVVKETVNVEAPKVQIKQHRGLLSILLK